MLRVLLICCVVLVGGLSGVAHAFSLGELQLLSKPGQPFQATAPIKLGKEEEITSVTIGSASDYALLNLPHTAAVETLSVQVKEQPDGPVVWLQGSTPIQEDDFFILLRVASNQHTFFPFFRLHAAPAVAGQEQKTGESKEQKQKQKEGKRIADTPVADTPVADTPVADTPVADTPVADTPVADTPMATTSSATRAPVVDKSISEGNGAGEAKNSVPQGDSVASSANETRFAPTESRSASKSARSASPQKAEKRQPSASAGVSDATSKKGSGQGNTYGPVREGEYLTEIVRQLHLVKGNASFFQAVVALWKHNPTYFIRNNMNGLKAGVMLTIPSAKEIAQVNVREARQLRLSHAMEWKKPRDGQKKMAGIPDSATEMTGIASPASASGGTVSTASSGGVSSKSHAEGGPGTENEELKAILTQLQVITRVLESNQAQQDRLEKRITSLEQAKKEWDFLRDRIKELENGREAGPQAATTSQSGPLPSSWGKSGWILLIAGAVGVVVLLGVALLWLGRRWNQADRWKSLQSLLSDTARQDPQLLREALKQDEPSFGRDFVPSVHSQKLEGVSPPIQKRVVSGAVAEAASKLEAMGGQKK